MIQIMLYSTYSVIALLVLFYGLYCLLLPGLRARLSFWRLGYRIVMAVRRRPAGPVARWRKRWARTVGACCLVLALVWLANLYPQVRLLSQPLYDPAVHRWQAENGDGAPGEARILQRLDEATQAVLKVGAIRQRRRPDMPIDVCVGMCVGVVHGDKTYVLRVGRKNIDSLEPLDADTEFEIGSITKTFTCAALASLVDEGTVRLDEPLAALLPDWTVPDYQGRKITLNDLATHRSGLPRMPHMPMKGATLDGLLFRGLIDPYRNGTPEYVRGFLAQYRLAREPGSQDEYSNLGVGLLGYALATKTRQPYESLIKQRILEPLGMRDTGVHMSAEQGARFPQGYIGPVRLGRLRVVFPMSRWTFAEGFQGCGSINSTVHDMLKYVRANIAAPEGLLGRTLARIQEPQADVRDIDNCKIGLGMFSMTIKGLDDFMYWHNGGTGGYNSFMAFSKKSKVGVVMLATGVCDEELGRALIKALAVNETT